MDHHTHTFEAARNFLSRKTKAVSCITALGSTQKQSHSSSNNKPKLKLKTHLRRRCTHSPRISAPHPPHHNPPVRCKRTLHYPCTLRCSCTASSLRWPYYSCWNCPSPAHTGTVNGKCCRNHRPRCTYRGQCIRLLSGHSD